MTKDFGDPTEGLLADVLAYVQTGTYSVQKPVVQSLPSKQEALAFHLNNKFTGGLNSKTFNGMLVNVKSLRLKKRP
jgi:carboxyl-terminal processing protease